MIRQPEQLLAENDPLAASLFKQYKQVKMPNLRLNDEETNALIGFLVSQSSAHDKQASAADETKTAAPAGEHVHPHE